MLVMRRPYAWGDWELWALVAWRALFFNASPPGRSTLIVEDRATNSATLAASCSGKEAILALPTKRKKHARRRTSQQGQVSFHRPPLGRLWAYQEDPRALGRLDRLVRAWCGGSRHRLPAPDCLGFGQVHIHPDHGHQDFIARAVHITGDTGSHMEVARNGCVVWRKPKGNHAIPNLTKGPVSVDPV